MSMLDTNTGEIIEVHPVADLFPMLADDELAELAEDIKQRGLLQPIVLDADGRVLDGRNRLAACHMIGMQPEFVTYDGDDAEGYALAVNIARRHLTKGQIAMVSARALSRNYSQREIADQANVSQSRVRQAAVVLDHAPGLADPVVSGALTLDKAYDQARENKRKAESTEAKMLRLRADAPDLAAKVTDGDLDLDDAVAALDERQRKAAERRRDARQMLQRAVDLVAPESASNGFVDSWAEHLGERDDELNHLINRAGQAAQVLLDLTERVAEQ